MPSPPTNPAPPKTLDELLREGVRKSAGLVGEGLSNLAQFIDRTGIGNALDAWDRATVGMPTQLPSPVGAVPGPGLWDDPLRLVLKGLPAAAGAAKAFAVGGAPSARAWEMLSDPRVMKAIERATHLIEQAGGDSSKVYEEALALAERFQGKDLGAFAHTLENSLVLPTRRATEDAATRIAQGLIQEGQQLDDVLGAAAQAPSPEQLLTQQADLAAAAQGAQGKIPRLLALRRIADDTGQRLEDLISDPAELAMLNRLSDVQNPYVNVYLANLDRFSDMMQGGKQSKMARAMGMTPDQTRIGGQPINSYEALAQAVTKSGGPVSVGQMRRFFQTRVPARFLDEEIAQLFDPAEGELLRRYLHGGTASARFAKQSGTTLEALNDMTNRLYRRVVGRLPARPTQKGLPRGKTR